MGVPKTAMPQNEIFLILLWPNFSKRKTLQFLGIEVFLVRPSGFEPLAFRLGEWPTLYHTSLCMYVYVSIFRGSFAFKVHPCSSVYLCVFGVSCSSFSLFLAVSKKEQRMLWHRPPILADFREKIYRRDRPAEQRRLPRTPTELLRNTDRETTEQLPGRDGEPIGLRASNHNEPYKSLPET